MITSSLFWATLTKYKHFIVGWHVDNVLHFKTIIFGDFFYVGRVSNSPRRISIEIGLIHNRLIYGLHRKCKLLLTDFYALYVVQGNAALTLPVPETFVKLHITFWCQDTINSIRLHDKR